MEKKPNWTTFFSRRLIDARKKAGLKQNEVAEMLGVPPVTVNRWEKGRRMPSAASINQLADLYKCDLRELIEGGEKNEGGDQGNKGITIVSEPQAAFGIGPLTEDERELVTLYRSASPPWKTHLIECARMAVGDHAQKSPGGMGRESDQKKSA